MFDVILILLVTVTGSGSHEQQNPVYRELIEQGVSSGKASQRLPPPTLPDGLSADEQAGAIEALAGNRYSFDKLTRPSVVAPQIVRVPRVESVGAEAPLRTVDAWFVVFADLDVVSDKDFMSKLLEGRQSQQQPVALTADQLQQRGIHPSDLQRDHEAFSHLTYDLLDKVRISTTTRSFWTRTDESIVAAVVLDRRFLGDREFPNESSLLQEAGEGEAGPPTPYQGMGFYAKITQLKRPSNALWVEYHAVFAEPVEWFRGTNQLGAKLPAVVQNQIREARRKMMSAGKSAASAR
jgi:hypothetical protein